MLGWNIFLIQGLNMLASPQIQKVKPADKKPGISDKSPFMRRRSVKFQFVWQNCVTTLPWPGCFKSMLACLFMCLALYCESVRFIDTATCQCRQLKLNLLSTEINFYCLMTNQTPALLVQRAPWTRAAVMLLQSLYFSHPSPPRAIMPDTRLLSTVHLKIKMSAINCKTCYIMTISRKNRGLWSWTV